ncbi:hypothetical protein CFC21_057169 [Triticum aestivum]|uniref:DUF6598 domain-containing protein n=2 Tax=Triticum aestivum TaxID=4565 RepID=A0A9R1GL86_WHEAT|nr:uncharacterized protein LOC123091538 [Triticum aestivum]KAF7048391.1 hypothetical protein CFC21_057169 [Triticum aestivum]
MEMVGDYGKFVGQQSEGHSRGPEIQSKVPDPLSRHFRRKNEDKGEVPVIPTFEDESLEGSMQLERQEKMLWTIPVSAPPDEQLALLNAIEENRQEQNTVRSAALPAIIPEVVKDYDADASSNEDKDKEWLEDRGKPLLWDPGMVLETDDKETQQLLKDRANKSDILDGGGHETKDEMDGGKFPVSEEQVTVLGTQEIPCSLLLLEIESYMQVLNELKDARRCFYGEELDNSKQLRIKGVAGTKEVAALHTRLSEAKRKMDLLLRGDTEAASRVLKCARAHEVERKQLTGVGMEDSFLEKQVIGPLPCEAGMGGESGKQQQSQFLPCRPGIQSSDPHMIEWTKSNVKATDLTPTITKSENGDNGDVDVDDRLATTFDQHMIERTKSDVEAADLIPTITKSDSSNDVDVDERLATTFRSDKLLLGAADLTPTITKSDSCNDIDVDERLATTFKQDKLLLEAADPVPTDTAYGNVDKMDSGKSIEQLDMEAMEMASEENDFALYAEARNKEWAHHGYFGDTTMLSSMQFAHLQPGTTKSYGVGFPPTLQIISVKLADIKGGLEWPLPVYGVVAVRDTMDHNRNLLFACDRNKCQIVEKDHPYLCLTGPSRAIVFEDGVILEIKLKLRGSTVSQDRALITCMRNYHAGKGTISFTNCFCTAELSLEVIQETVQATILGIRVKGGSWPSKYGGRVVCFAPVEVIDGQDISSPEEVVLLDSRRGAMPRASDGYLRLSRHVVSVEIRGSLEVVLQSYCASGDIVSETNVSLGKSSLHPIISMHVRRNVSLGTLR